MAETLKGLTINDAGYYDSDKNNAEGDPVINQKVVTHTSDRKKRKVTDIINRNLQHKLLINWTLQIITMTIDPWILDRVATCRRNSYACTTHTTKLVILDAARSSACITWTPRQVSRTGRD